MITREFDCFWMILILFLTMTFGIARADNGVPPDTDAIIKRIVERDRSIKDIRLRSRTTIPDEDRPMWDIEWGYEQGKEYIEGTQYLTTEDGSILLVETKNTFDGTRQIIFWDQEISGGGRFRSARITSYDPATWRGDLTFGTLLGNDVRWEGTQSVGEVLSEILSNEPRSVRTYKSNYRGSEVIVVEAEDVDWENARGIPFDARVWLDPSRDYAMIKFEKFYAYPADNRWKYPIFIVDNIRLAEIDGYWVPVAGDRDYYGHQTVVREDASPDGAYIDVVQPIGEPELAVKTRHIEIESASIRINKGIPPEKFTVELMDGDHVWDDFKGFGYVIGGTDEIDERFRNEPGNLIDAGELSSIGDSTPVRPNAKGTPNGTFTPTIAPSATLSIGVKLIIVSLAMLILVSSLAAWMLRPRKGNLG